MSVCCACCVLSGRGLCDEMITRPEEFYRLWCVVVCDLETIREWGGPGPLGGCRAKLRKKCIKITVIREEEDIRSHQDRHRLRSLGSMIRFSPDSRTDGLTFGQRATRLEGEDRNLSGKYSQRYCRVCIW